MASHNACKLPSEGLKKRIPLADSFLSKNVLASQKTVENVNKKICPKSKLPVPIGRKAPGVELVKFRGLSLSDTSVGTEAKSTNSSVEAVPNNACSSVNVEPEALNVVLVAQSTQNDTCLKLVKEDSDMSTVHSMLDDTETFAFYREKLAKFGGTDLNETVREIGQQLISDEVLKNYSYLGRRKKLRFKDYDNITKLVIESAIEAIKRRHFEIYKKAMVQSEDEVKKLHTDVEDYFTKEYISKAETRLNRSTQRRV